MSATLAACRESLVEVVDGWLLLGVTRRMPIPPLGDVRLELPEKMTVA